MTYVVTLQSASGSTLDITVIASADSSESAVCRVALGHVASPAEKSRGWRVLRVLPRW